MQGQLQVILQKHRQTETVSELSKCLSPCTNTAKEKTLGVIKREATEQSYCSSWFDNVKTHVKKRCLAGEQLTG